MKLIEMEKVRENRAARTERFFINNKTAAVVAVRHMRLFASDKPYNKMRAVNSFVFFFLFVIKLKQLHILWQRNELKMVHFYHFGYFIIRRYKHIAMAH